ncbi:MAG: hypothetical protein AAFQ45_11840 [Pseudomonadota bacterium]
MALTLTFATTAMSEVDYQAKAAAFAAKENHRATGTSVKKLAFCPWSPTKTEEKAS